MTINANWIAPATPMGDVCPRFVRSFEIEKAVSSATLTVTVMGVYEASLNGERIGDYVLAPGWTYYDRRHQFQTYDVTAQLIPGKNELTVLVGKGWYRGPWGYIDKTLPAGLIACLEISYADGTVQTISSDESWKVTESQIRFSELYNGETADGSFVPTEELPVMLLDRTQENLIPQQGEKITEQNRVHAKRIFTTPAGERVVDFGQEVTGYVQFTVTGQAGDAVEISHAEVLDKNGNFYTENYRSAKAKLCYTCRDGVQTYKPHLTFFGFRYIRLDSFPGTPRAEDFVAIAVSSQLRRTGRVRSGNRTLNRFYENVIWGQRSNFLDVPTDCPQRDERLGWTGDAQVFAKTATYNFNVKKFFRKWLSDLAAEQFPSGLVPNFIPAIGEKYTSAAWGDAAVIVPWQMYLSYGDKADLAAQFESMKAWVGYIGSATRDEFLWTGGTHFGDWLGLDAPAGSYKGSSREDLLASAFYANAADILAQTCEVLGVDGSEYRTLHQNIVNKFRLTFPTYLTQTENVVALTFGLTPDPASTAADLAELVRKAGPALRTGFVGTPYLLYALGENGYADLAYELLCKEDYPSWLFQVNRGATTVWEHWDGMNEAGDFWSPDMNSFNHYAYGSVIGWVCEFAAGISPAIPGYAEVNLVPHPDSRLGWLEVSLETEGGEIFSGWYYEQGGLRYEIRTPVPANLTLNGRTVRLAPGSYLFFGE